MSSPRLYIYIFFLFDRAREELEPVGKGAHNFFPIEEPCKSFWKLKYITKNEVTDSIVFRYFPKILHGVLLPSYNFREWPN